MKNYTADNVYSIWDSIPLAFFEESQAFRQTIIVLLEGKFEYYIALLLILLTKVSQRQKWACRRSLEREYVFRVF
jgi:hypothetical protein